MKIFFIFFIFLSFNISSINNEIVIQDTVNNCIKDFSYSEPNSKDSIFILSRASRIINFCNLNSNLNETIENYFFDTFLKIIHNVDFDLNINQYNNFIKNCLIFYKKSDLIFPFHYYW
jgi:hypothetical protein